MLQISSLKEDNRLHNRVIISDNTIHVLNRVVDPFLLLVFTFPLF